MAEAKLVVTLVDKATTGLRSLRAHWLAVTAALAGAITFAEASLKAFAEQEAAISKLNTALKNQGITSKEVSNDLIKYASQLQKITTFSDETIIETQALLTTFGLAGNVLKNATKSALDLSAGLGIDLRTSTLLLGKAFIGETATLARYGIKISETIPVSERFAAVQDQINLRFGGSAQAQATTYAGKVSQLKNEFNDLQERIGSLLVGPATSLIGFLRDGIILTEKFTGWIIKNKDAFKLLNPILNSNVGLMQIGVALGQKLLGIQKETAAIPPPAAPIKPAVAPIVSDEILNLQTQAQKKIDLFTLTNEEIEKREIESLARRLEANNLFEKARELRKAVAVKSEIALEKAKAEALSIIFGNFAAFQTAKNKELIIVGKAAAIAQATIDTYAAVGRAIGGPGALPPPWSYAVAASVLAFGLSNVARIAGVPLAHGGVVLPTMGGTLATVGEGGRSEAVIPLGDSRAKEELRDTIGGTTININVNGTVIADDYSIGEFAQRIDEELFRLRRNRQANAF